MSDTAEASISGLGPVDRQESYRALDALLADPYPDCASKLNLPFPYREGTIGFAHGEFWISYVILNSATTGVASVYWSPDSHRRAGGIIEI